MIEIRRSKKTAEVKTVIHAFCNELGLGNEIEKQMVANIPTYTNYLAIRGTRIVGGIGYMDVKPVPLAEYLWVAPEFRKGIVGGLLGRKVLKDTKGKLRILASVERSAMYEKIGFKPVYQILERRAH